MEDVAMRNRQKGSAVVETALLIPWLFFLFVGVLDIGFYSYASICTQNAARAAAILIAKGGPVCGTGTCQPQATATLNACTAALWELNALPNAMGLKSGCAGSPGAITNTMPVAVVATPLSGAQCADCCAGCSHTTATSWQAAVTYQSVPLIPIPGVLVSRL